ncbi:unnamed protein product [Brassica napus]|uniref:(rape) hypothetical protein n=1 Tax=Brassica napus TaxID=3708 RepID=A0A816NVB1_BRANA|nr:unnamed protein product [Brassica napus]
MMVTRPDSVVARVSGVTTRLDRRRRVGGRLFRVSRVGSSFLMLFELTFTRRVGACGGFSGSSPDPGINLLDLPLVVRFGVVSDFQLGGLSSASWSASAFNPGVMSAPEYPFLGGALHLAASSAY